LYFNNPFADSEGILFFAKVGKIISLFKINNLETTFKKKNIA